MSYTVWGAFNSFRENTVDLNSEQTKKARSSRDYLLEQLKTLSQKDSNFPKLFGGYISYGSFARSTKIRPLDDIDLLIPLNGRGTTSVQKSDNIYTYWLRIDDKEAPLAKFPDDHGYVNSTKILNKIKSSLSDIKNYSKAEIKKTMQAVTLNLSSYDWVFDIVPAIPINDFWGNIEYYLIPNGYGDWLRTDPRKDSENATRINKQHNSMFLPTLRLLKYWNRRTHKPRLMSYYFETLAVKTFDYALTIDDFPKAVKYFFDNATYHLNLSCPDPKGLGPNLDANVDSETKKKITEALSDAAEDAKFALMYQNDLSDEKNAIYWWGRIFGSSFPSYG